LAEVVVEPHDLQTRLGESLIHREIDFRVGAWKSETSDPKFVCRGFGGHGRGIEGGEPVLEDRLVPEIARIGEVDAAFLVDGDVVEGVEWPAVVQAGKDVASGKATMVAVLGVENARARADAPSSPARWRHGSAARPTR
ncbi:hypothetical protein B4Q13_16870, partial [Lacticaseibacillus rhamnosus]